MKTVLLLRHAKASRDDPELADHDRPLTDRGRRDSRRVGRLMKDEGLVPDWWISSTAARARQTAELVATIVADPELVHHDRSFYLARPDAYIPVLRALPDEINSVIVVGHNPGLEDLVAFLTGHDEHLPTAALVVLTFPDKTWQRIGRPGSAELVSTWRPKELD
jgi:phosphohistidine phosphatase